MPSAIDTSVSAQGSQSGNTEELDPAYESLYGLDGAEDIQRPPISPITPTASFERLAEGGSSESTFPHVPPDESRFIERPTSLPVDEESNPDITALRAAASVLQLQKQKAQRDIQTLKEIRDAAVQEPERFVDELRSGNLQHEPDHSNPLKATFEDASEDESDKDVPMVSSDIKSRSKFKQIPSAQNVVRCPPVNWEKYHVVGESLDRMHEEQRIRPTPGQPWSEEREAIIAAPYSPFRDKPQPQASQLPPPMQTRRSFRRKSQG